MRRRVFSASLLALGAAVLAAPALAVHPAEGVAPVHLLPAIEMPEQDNDMLREEAYILDRDGSFRYAEPIKTDITPQNSGAWEDLPGGTSVWRTRVSSKNAVSMNFGFTRYWMPPGGTLLIYTPDKSRSIAAFDSADNEEHGELWTPMIFADEVVIEVQVPTALKGELDLLLGSVNHGFRQLGDTAEKSGSCNVDVVCPEGDGYRDIINSSGVISTGGSTFCSGSLVNNTAFDGRPLFLTANHCGIGAGNAASLVVYWKFENSTCRPVGSPASGGPGDGQLSIFNTGSIFRATSAASDFSLVELDDPVPEAAEPFYAGWDRSGAEATTAIAIHHPNTDEKRISFEFQPTTTTNYLSATVTPSGTHVRVADWDIGTTEPGSSGSPLYDQNKRLIGQLHGGYAACGNNDSDWYGRVSVSWEGGGTPSTRMRDWLDPLGTGALFIDGYGGSPFQQDGAPLVDDTTGTGDGDGVLERGEGPILLTFPVINNGPDLQIGVIATLTVGTPGVNVLQGTSTYPDLGSGQSASNIAPLSIELTPDYVCGTPLSLQLLVSSATSDGGPISYALPTGPVCDVLADFAAAGIVVDDTLGNDNGAPEPEDTIAVRLDVSSLGADATNVTGTLSSPSTGVIIHQGASAFPDLATGQTATNISDFIVELGPGTVCGGDVVLLLDLVSDQGSQQLEYSFRTGLPFGSEAPVTASNTPGAAIGPNAGTETSTTFTLAEVGQLLDMNVYVSLTHTYMGDLSMTLTAPTGQVITLFNRRGGSADNMLGATFDDEAAVAITSGSPPYSGSFRPETPLSAFDGIEVTGDWTFTVRDNAGGDAGVLNEVRLIFEYEEYRCGDDPKFQKAGEPVLVDNRGNGNANGVIEPGETTIDLTIPVYNGGFNGTGVVGTLSSPDAWIRVVNATASYDDLNSGQTKSASVPFTIARDPASDCGGMMTLDLHVTSDQGGDAFFTYEVNTSVLGTVTRTYSAAPAAAFGLQPTTVSVPLVATEAGTVIDVDATVDVTHAKTSEVRMTLTSPSGASSTLVALRGDDGQNFLGTTFDDEATATIATGTAPFSGSYRPETPLSAMDNGPLQGTWTLLVEDTNGRGGFNGVVNEVSVTVSARMPVCDPVLMPEVGLMDAAGGGAVGHEGRVELGTIAVGESLSRTFMVHNAGDAPLLVWGTSVQYPYTLVVEPPAEIAPGSSASFTVALQPGAKGYAGEGPAVGDLRFLTNTWEVPEYRVTLSANVGESSGVQSWMVLGD